MANIFCSSVAYSAVAVWSASTAITVGTIRRQLATPTAGNERCFRCSTAGTTGATEPTWVITANGTTTDGTVTWTECTGQAAYNGNGGGSAWGAPHSRIAVANSFSTAGDTIFLASNHSESGTYSITLSITGTQAARTRFLSVDETVVPVSNLTTLKIGASASNSNGSSNIAGSSATTGCAYFYGVSFTQTQAAAVFAVIGNGNSDLTFESCRFQMSNNTTNSGFAIGQANPSSTNKLKFTNCTFRFSNTGQYVAFRGGQSVFQGLLLDAAGSAPSTLLRVLGGSNTAVDCLIADSDLSLVTGTLFDLANAGYVFASLRLSNCKLGAGVTLPTTVNRSGYRFRMDNCDSSGTNNRFYQLDFAGTVQRNTSTTVTGLSAQFDTNTNVAWETPLEFALAPVRVTGGAATTLTYYIASTGQLNNSECWIEVEYPGSASSPLTAMASSGMTTVTGSPSSLASTFANWSGNPPYFYTKTITFTPAMSGWALPVMKVAKKSATVYVDMNGGSLVPGLGFSNPSGGLLVHPGMSGGMRG